MKKEKTKEEHIEKDYAFERVPETSRIRFWPMLFIMLGFTFCSSSMTVGSKLGNGLDLSGYLLATIIGGVVLAAYTGTLGYIGSSSGLSFDHLAQRAFGISGSYLPSAMIAITQIGWFGVAVAMFAGPAADLLGIPSFVLVIAAGICMTTSAFFGIRGMEIISYISVPLVLLLGSFSMAKALVDGGGIIAVFEKSTGGMTLFTGVSLVVGSFISGGTTIPNFARFARSGKAATVSIVMAFFLGSCLMFAFGAVGGAFTGRDDIYYAMIAQGLAVPALIVLGANAWTTNDNALYSSALGLSNLTKIRKRPLVIVSGVIGTALSVWLYENFTDWLLVLNAALPPVGAIIILDYFRHRKNYTEEPQDGVTEESVKESSKAVDLGAVAGVVAGALVGIFVPYGISSINSMAIACAVKLLCDKNTALRR